MNRTKMFHVKRFGTIAGPLSLQHLTGGGLRRVAWREEYVFLSSKAIQRRSWHLAASDLSSGILLRTVLLSGSCGEGGLAMIDDQRSHRGNLQRHSRPVRLGRDRQAHRRSDEIGGRLSRYSTRRTAGELTATIQCRSVLCRFIWQALLQDKPPQRGRNSNRPGEGAVGHIHHPDRCVQSLGVLQ